MLRFLHKILPCQNLILFQTYVCLEKGMKFSMAKKKIQKNKNSKTKKVENLEKPKKQKEQ